MAWSRWDGTAWAPWADIGGATANAPSCVQGGDGRLSCFAVATSGELQQTTFEGGAWSAWIGRGGALRRQPACLAYGPAGIECFALGADQQVWQVSFDGAAWATPRSLGGQAGNRPACYARGAGIDCYIPRPELPHAGQALRRRRLGRLAHGRRQRPVAAVVRLPRRPRPAASAAGATTP